MTYQEQLVKSDEDLSYWKKAHELAAKEAGKAQALARDLGQHLETIQPQLELLEQQKLELTQLCDKVRDRMRRKELAEEQAILNRKAATFQPFAPRANRRTS